MPKIGKTILKLLLVITMLIEPAVFSYAMAGGGHSHDGSAVMAPAHDSHHASMSPGADEVHKSSGQNQVDGNGFLDNCCSAPACGAAMPSGFGSPISETPSRHYISFVISWEGVVLPSEIKPPRNLLG